VNVSLWWPWRNRAWTKGTLRGLALLFNPY
jgi:hypothetical protein